jgi:hypothetical protein
MGTTEKSQRLRNDFKQHDPGDDSSRELPSWIPDWTVAPYKYETQRLDRAPLYDASKGESPDESIFDDRFMELNGINFDVVVQMGAAMPEDYDGSLQVFQEWQELAGIREPTSAKYVGGGQMIDAYWRTLCMDTIYIGRESDFDNLPLSRQDYQRAGKKYTKEYSQWLNDGHDRVMEDIQAELQKTFTFRPPSTPQYANTAPFGAPPQGLSNNEPNATRRTRTASPHTVDPMKRTLPLPST